MDFPKEIYVNVAKDGDTEFLIATETLDEQAEVNATVRVAKYRLVEVGKVRAIPTFSVTKG
jgi:hypothetical protein